MSKWDTSERTVAQARILTESRHFDGDMLDALERVNPRARWGE